MTIGATDRAAAAQSTATTAHTPQKYAFIDALRGYAVLLVITCHTGGVFRELPYPVRKLTNFGWHGVQLFFLVSCVTLMMSWRSDERKGIADARAFWLRRFFRIAPMYYLAGVFYFIVDRPAGGFDFGQWLASAAFVNAWHPLLTPTVPGRWMVVPGGWSIGVEFTFYFAFPLIARHIRAIGPALGFFAVAVLVGCAANTLVRTGLVASYGVTAADNFLYFWFPDQLPIFALGAILYLAIERCRAAPDLPLARMMTRFPNVLLAICAVLIVFLAENPHVAPERLSLSPFAPFPFLMAASLVFMAITLTLALNAKNPAINRWVCAMGEASFSAYILHFFVLAELVRLLPALFDPAATGYAAIFRCLALWMAAVPITFILSTATYRVIELPMIRVGRSLLERRAAKRAAAALVQPSAL